MKITESKLHLHNVLIFFAKIFFKNDVLFNDYIFLDIIFTKTQYSKLELIVYSQKAIQKRILSYSARNSFHLMLHHLSSHELHTKISWSQNSIYNKHMTIFVYIFVWLLLRNEDVTAFYTSLYRGPNALCYLLLHHYLYSILCLHCQQKTRLCCYRAIKKMKTDMIQ